jgi:hypothetical protein
MAAKTAQIAAVEDRQATLRQRGRLEPTNPAVVTIDGAVVWRGTAPGCGEGSWWVRLVIRQGEVVDIEPEAEPKGGDAPVVCRPPQLIGASIGDAADTTLVARIVTGSAAQEKDAAGAASR